ncbi:uncharacterized protein L969DRAFT_44561 [Mixia osmundae IAM 14324]|uniref:DUF202 domain-containing protein n=1 Tax=Mixia osmundae (strain CBS 9802 / IAM 14324 / JCM 22182 / KY 12970) TaxID=764103 RepID=G7DYA4_MIXOS|nr:uncharacterized protein L969DRAFT_44561 [Mixia osmundae IAM 14324]KEI41466.1 hypothetical protein L969DRAFT_44561 [Mixia osmundae IAM 14324]GAA95564.1 hypothetical protein E5Q_02219 [Mixia osmundae IAM 14324]
MSGYGATTATTAPAKAAQVSRIEPKVYLAAERTLLNWLRVALLIGSFSLALFNAKAATEDGRAGETLGKIMGFIYALISVGVIGYSYFMFELRRKRIGQRYGGHFDELYGPMVICVTLFLAVLANFILRVVNRVNTVPTPKHPWAASFLSSFVTLENRLPAYAAALHERTRVSQTCACCTWQTLINLV